MAWTKPPQC